METVDALLTSSLARDDLDALTAHMETNTINMLYDVACAVSVVGSCMSVIWLIPNALIVFS